MKHRDPMDALSLLSDVLFEETDAPIPSFRRKASDMPLQKVAESTDIVESAPTWQPAQ